MFKKRNIKSNLRKFNEETSLDGRNSDDDVIDLDGFAEVKNRQIQRKRIKHDFSEIPEPQDFLKSANKSNAVKSIEEMIGSQFTVKAENNSNYNNHEKLMEKYINDKLGLLRDSSNQIGNLKNQTEIFYQDETNKKNKDDSDIGIIGLGSGLAEVDLPMKYKLANIEETELAKKKVNEQKRIHNHNIKSQINSNLASFRFHKPTINVTIQPNQYTSHGIGSSRDDTTVSKETSITIPTVSLPKSTDTSSGFGKFNDGRNLGQNNTQHDDMLLAKFKKSLDKRR